MGNEQPPQQPPQEGPEGPTPEDREITEEILAGEDFTTEGNRRYARELGLDMPPPGRIRNTIREFHERDSKDGKGSETPQDGEAKGGGDTQDI